MKQKKEMDDFEAMMDDMNDEIEKAESDVGSIIQPQD
tara:strand:- start:285 stop:395 length:111 start_codon:yes stop_codon:yes gene_type:complete